MTPRDTALITGAAGGMGRACARLFGAAHTLVLTDASPGLESFADELRADGHEVEIALVGDLNDDGVLAEVTASVDRARPLKLVHTAGLSPSQAAWRAIMSVNVVATERLLRRVEPVLAPGSAAILIASAAGHVAVEAPGAAAILADPLAPDFLDRIGALIEAASGGSDSAASGLGYALSKQAVLALCERKSVAWGRMGARLVSISPGLTLTPMGRRELERTPGAVRTRDAAPAGRAGTAMDIALAARFLASAEAGFITGTDLRVDGGSIAAMRGTIA